METLFVRWYGCCDPLFLPYLWGMETNFHPNFELALSSSYRTYEEWKLFFLLFSSRLCDRSYRTYEEWKPQHWIIFHSQSNSSYRTYEEWKLRIPSPFRIEKHSSYRTYEEWKLLSILTPPLSFLSSYRTYEEWKHNLLISLSNLWYPFLPYLWGMETRFLTEYLCRPHFVLTVPMRNGNSTSMWAVMLFLTGSYRTLEELK